MFSGINRGAYDILTASAKFGDFINSGVLSTISLPVWLSLYTGCDSSAVSWGRHLILLDRLIRSSASTAFSPLAILVPGWTTVHPLTTARYVCKNRKRSDVYDWALWF